MHLSGAEEFKQLAQRLRNIAQNRRTRFPVHISLPHYVLEAEAGAGATTCLRLLSRLLEEERLFRFEGETRMFEWMLDENAFNPGGSFDALLGEMEDLSGFHQSFRGVIGLDIDAWVGCEERQGFERLIHFAEAVHGRVLLVFMIRHHDRGDVNILLSRLALRMPIESVRLACMEPMMLAECFAGFLQRRGVQAETDEKLTQYFAKMIHLDGFAGLKTLEHLADGAIYTALATDKIENGHIGAEQMMECLNALERCMRSTVHITKEKRKIGFSMTAGKAGEYELV